MNSNVLRFCLMLLLAYQNIAYGEGTPNKLVGLANATLKSPEEAKQQGLLLLSNKEYSAAISVYRNALLRFPQDADLYQHLAQAHLLEHDISTAVEVLQRGIENAKEISILHRELGVLFIKNGNAIEGINHLHKSHTADPCDAVTCCRIADTYLMRNQIKDSLSWYEKAKKIDASNLEAVAGIGHINVALGKNHNSPILHYNLGCALMGLGNMRGAEMAFRTALTYDPHYINASFKLLELLFQQKDTAEAHKFFVATIRQARKKITIDMGKQQ